MFHLCETSKIGKSKEIEGNWWLPGGMGSECLMGMEFYVGLMRMLWNRAEVTGAHYECTKCS